MRKEFPLRLICFLITVLMVIVISKFEVFEVDIVYAEPNDEMLTHFGSTFENYKIIIFFCIGIILCNLINKMEWMWMFSAGLLLGYPLISDIERLACLDLKLLYAEKRGEEVLSIIYTPLPASMLLRICSVLVFFLCSILFFLEKKEQKRIALLIGAKREEEALEEKRKDEEWKKSLFNPDLMLDKFPSNKKGDES